MSGHRSGFMSRRSRPLGERQSLLPRRTLSEQLAHRHHHPWHRHPEDATQTILMAVQRAELAVEIAGNDLDLVVGRARGAPEELDAAVELVAPEERHGRVRRGRLAT